MMLGGAYGTRGDSLEECDFSIGFLMALELWPSAENPDTVWFPIGDVRYQKQMGHGITLQMPGHQVRLPDSDQDCTAREVCLAA